MTMVRYPLPITNAMLARANAVNEAKPRYSTGADWQGGATGNEEDVATATSSLTDVSGVTVGPYAPKTQAAKAAAMVPPLQILDDLGKDTGAYAGQAGRTGPVTPGAPYPDATSPPIVTNVSPGTGLAAGGTAITITGAGFTGATGVTVGGVAATAVVVVNSNTITATTPVHAAGTVDVAVTTPKGTSAVGGAADNFVYT
jgi:hypothetical protein